MFSEDLKLKPLLLCLMLLSGSALAQRRPVPQPSAEQVAAKALPAVALVVCDNGQKGSQASGFFVKPGILVTNYHVIHNMDRGAVQMVVGPKKTRRQFRIVEVVNFDEESDLALLSVPEAKKATVPLLTLAPAVPNVGAAVFALGNPEGLVGTISPGIVSAPPRLTGRKFRLQITAPVSEGSSGGPVVNSRAEVVGIVQGSITEGQEP